jgi:trimeric autotransporter adhesin
LQDASNPPLTWPRVEQLARGDLDAAAASVGRGRGLLQRRSGGVAAASRNAGPAADDSDDNTDFPSLRAAGGRSRRGRGRKTAQHSSGSRSWRGRAAVGTTPAGDGGAGSARSVPRRAAAVAAAATLGWASAGHSDSEVSKTWHWPLDVRCLCVLARSIPVLVALPISGFTVQITLDSRSPGATGSALTAGPYAHSTGVSPALADARSPPPAPALKMLMLENEREHVGSSGRSTTTPIPPSDSASAAAVAASVSARTVDDLKRRRSAVSQAVQQRLADTAAATVREAEERLSVLQSLAGAAKGAEDAALELVAAQAAALSAAQKRLATAQRDVEDEQRRLVSAEAALSTASTEAQIASAAVRDLCSRLESDRAKLAQALTASAAGGATNVPAASRGSSASESFVGTPTGTVTGVTSTKK